MSSKAYQEASKKLNNKCRDAIHNLYMAGTNHNGHSWNAFGDVENCLAVVIDEMHTEGLKKGCYLLLDHVAQVDGISDSDWRWLEKMAKDIIAGYEKEQK